MADINKITPFLWFDGTAEEAMNFYVSIFGDSKIVNVMPGTGGKAMGVRAIIAGQPVMALNGGPKFKFNEAFSFYVNCQSQEEVDGFWEKLSEGGEKGQCGWLKDKFGLSWQVIPDALGRLMNSGDSEKSKRVMDAMLKMTKIDIAELEKTAKGE